MLPASEVSTEARIEEGIPGNELLREAEIGDYDLAIIGATGVSDLKHTMLGSFQAGVDRALFGRSRAVSHSE